jgi:hypothetical protein
LTSSLIADDSGKALDGEWNVAIPDTDTITQPDNLGYPARPLISGNNTVGGDFLFHFAVLPSGTSTPFTATQPTGDYVDNEIVDIGDYELWRATYGYTGNQPADGNLNGVVDLADYALWRDNQYEFSAWSAGPTGGGSLMAGTPVVDPANAPSVSNVTISDSKSSDAPYSFKGPEVSGELVRAVPVAGTDTISITFSEDVHVFASDLKVVGLKKGNVPQVAEFKYDIATMTATWRLVGWTSDEPYAVSLNDFVTDIEGNRFEGKWRDPAAVTATSAAVSEFPSNDSVTGGSFQFTITLISPDANLIRQAPATDDDSLLSLAGNGGVNEPLLDYDFSPADPKRANGNMGGDNDAHAEELDLAFAQFGLNFDALR